MISIENIGKRYQLGSSRKSGLQETLTGIFKKKDEQKDFWALRNINLEIGEGEVVGIIGRNGAGKSTLLKILSRITHPSEGKVVMNGRVSSLLEVGTGFHAELSGRENIYLNGTILGMTRPEVKSKFDEIVAFAEIEDFLDTAVKHYSSGMYVRLAFAVAAHLEPEILIIDEVLAVGDAEFQKKCLGKMEGVAREGRTVLFVSHNMNAVEKLCNRGVLLQNGSLVKDSGDLKSVIATYLSTDDTNTQNVWENSGKEFKNDYLFPNRLEVISGDNNQTATFSNNEDVLVRLTGEIFQADRLLNAGIGLYDETGRLLFWSLYKDISESEIVDFKNGNFELTVKLPQRLLNEGKYHVEFLASMHFKFWILAPNTNAPKVSFEIRGGLSDSPYFIQKREGQLAPVLDWKLNQ